MLKLEASVGNWCTHSNIDKVVCYGWSTAGWLSPLDRYRCWARRWHSWSSRCTWHCCCHKCWLSAVRTEAERINCSDSEIIICSTNQLLWLQRSTSVENIIADCGNNSSGLASETSIPINFEIDYRQSSAVGCNPCNCYLCSILWQQSWSGWLCWHWCGKCSSNRRLKWSSNSISCSNLELVCDSRHHSRSNTVVKCCYCSNLDKVVWVHICITVQKDAVVIYGRALVVWSSPSRLNWVVCGCYWWRRGRVRWLSCKYSNFRTWSSCANIIECSYPESIRNTSSHWSSCCSESSWKSCWLLKNNCIAWNTLISIHSITCHCRSTW